MIKIYIYFFKYYFQKCTDFNMYKKRDISRGGFLTHPYYYCTYLFWLLRTCKIWTIKYDRNIYVRQLQYGFVKFLWLNLILKNHTTS
jgi:hypothetical protein